jgi:hemoglobin
MNNQSNKSIKNKFDKNKFSTLFNKIGGEQGLKNFLDKFYEKLSKDIMIGFFFEGKDLKHIASKQAEFLMKSMGILKSYTGKSPSLAHKNLAPILPGFFDRRLTILREMLRDQGLSEDEVELWINFENSFRKSIVSDKK